LAAELTSRHDRGLAQDTELLRGVVRRDLEVLGERLYARFTASIKAFHKPDPQRLCKDLQPVA